MSIEDLAVKWYLAVQSAKAAKLARQDAFSDAEGGCEYESANMLEAAGPCYRVYNDPQFFCPHCKQLQPQHIAYTKAVNMQKARKRALTMAIKKQLETGNQ